MTSLDSNISTADEFNFGPDGPPMDNVGPMELGITWAFMVPSFLAVALRFYCRGIMLRMIGYDDWFILVSLTLVKL